MKTLKDLEYDRTYGSIIVNSDELREVAKEWVKYFGNIDFPKKISNKRITEYTDPFVAVEIAFKHFFNLEEDK